MGRGAQRRGGEGLAGRTACTRPRGPASGRRLARSRNREEPGKPRVAGEGEGRERKPAKSQAPKAQSFLSVYSECLYFCVISTLPSAVPLCLLSSLHSASFFPPPPPTNPRPRALTRTPLSVLWVPSAWPPPPLCSPALVSLFPLCFLCLRMNLDARGWGVWNLLAYTGRPLGL